MDGATVSAGEQWYVEALFDYSPQHGDELGFRAGDLIQVVREGEPGGWWEGVLNGQKGYFPSHFCNQEQTLPVRPVHSA